MTDLIIIIAIVAIIGFAGGYIYKEKKNGKNCIGCPYRHECTKKSCSCDDK